MSSITTKNPNALVVVKSLTVIAEGVKAMQKHPVPVRLQLAKCFRELALLGEMEGEAPSDLLVVAIEHESICERFDCLVNVAKALEDGLPEFKPS